MEYRPYYLAREWVRAGHEVRMLAADFSHVRSCQPQAPGRQRAGCWRELIDGIDYHWYATPAYGSNGIGRVRNIATFMGRTALDARRIAREFRPDAVIASSTYPMDIWVARRVAHLAGAKLVFEVHDLWPLSPIEIGGMSPRHPFIRVCQAAEDAAYRDADVVVSMLPNVGLHMAARGLDLRRLRIVPNGIAPDEWRGDDRAGLREDIAAHIRAQRQAGRLVVGYSGSHGVPNALEVLIDSAAQLRAERLAFVLVGDGLEKARLVERAAAAGLEHLRFFDPVPKAQMPALLEGFDIAYIGWHRLPIYRFGIAPNKLLDYMMAGRAVLHSVEAGNDPVAEAGCGLTVAPESVPEVVSGLRELGRLDEAERAALGERGRRHVTAHHTYPVLAAQFIQALQQGAQP
jgi:glycosyltransferase involved in cell wall biosynthesis